MELNGLWGVWPPHKGVILTRHKAALQLTCTPHKGVKRKLLIRHRLSVCEYARRIVARQCFIPNSISVLILYGL